jgi:hypothetical protein
VDLDLALLLRILGPGAALSHETAALRHGLALPVDTGPVHVTVPAGRRWSPIAGVVIHPQRAGEAAVRTGPDRLPTATPLRTLRQLNATACLAATICAADSALRLGLLDEAELASAPGLARIAALADRRADSPLESLARVAVVVASLGPVRPQFQLPGFPHRYDLALEWAGLLAELDGSQFHDDADPESFRRDRAHGNEVAKARGFALVRGIWQQVWPSPVPFVELLRTAASARAGQRCRNLRRPQRRPFPAPTRARLLVAWRRRDSHQRPGNRPLGHGGSTVSGCTSCRGPPPRSSRPCSRAPAWAS